MGNCQKIMSTLNLKVCSQHLIESVSVAEEINMAYPKTTFAIASLKVEWKQECNPKEYCTERKNFVLMKQ